MTATKPAVTKPWDRPKTQLPMAVTCPTCQSGPACYCRKWGGPYQARVQLAAKTPVETDLDCTKCGACCHAWPWTGNAKRTDHLFVPVGPRDALRLGRRLPVLTVVGDTNKDLPVETESYENCFYMRVEDGRCVALKGQIGGPIKCGIYEQRPATCRNFEPGSYACRVIRFRMGLLDPGAQKGDPVP